MNVMKLSQKESNVIIQEEEAFEYFLETLTTSTQINVELYNGASAKEHAISLDLEQFALQQRNEETKDGSDDNNNNDINNTNINSQPLCLLRNPKTTCNWITNELFGRIKRFREINDDNSTQRYAPLLETNLVTPQQLATIIDLVTQEQISGKQAKVLLDTIFNSTTEVEDPSELHPLDMAKELGLLMDNNPERAQQLIDIVVKLYPEEVKQYVEHNRKNQFGFLTGQVIKLSQQQQGLGELNGKLISQTLQKQLDEMKSSVNIDAKH
eukprot:UN04571